MGIEFRLLSTSGTETVPLPDVESFSLSPVFCDAGAIEFQYPRDGVNWQSLAALDEIRLAVYVDGIRQPRLDAILQDIDGDDIKEASVWKYSGFFNLGRLNEGIVYPKGWPTVDPLNTKYLLESVTAGEVMRTFLLAAQARGALLDITFSTFSTTTDSNGLQWPTELSAIEYTPGVGLLEVLKGLYAADLCEFEMVGTDLRLYRPGTLGTDLTNSAQPMVFRKGRDLTDSPRKTSTRGVATAMLGAGEEGLYHEEFDSGAIATRRRIEKMSSSGGIKDAGTLEAYTEAQLGQVVNGKLEKSHGLNFAEESTPRPIRDFGLGDWAYSDVGRGTVEKYQVKQWTLKYAANGQLTGSVVLNDLFDAQEVVLAKTVKGIVGGSTITGASQAVDRTPGELVDGVGPNTPGGLGLTSAAYLTADGQTYASVTATYPQVTTNSDGTVIEDLAGYIVRWAYESSPTGWQLVYSDGVATVVTFSSVPVGTPIRAQVQAYDRGGWKSGWSTPITFHTTASDATVPEKPSTIVADSVPGGLLRGTWDGKTASGGAWAPDVQQWKVYAGTTSNFIPATANHVDTLTGPGSVYLDPGYGQSRYFKIVGVDRNGNAGPASDPSTNVTTTKLLGDDIFDGAVGSIAIADGAIINAKIASLAVNDAKVGGLSAAKIETGVMHAEITVSGRIATALSGRRSEMNGIGFQSWNSAGALTVSIDGENNLLMGIFRTSLTGRRIEMGAGGDSGQISFYGPDGRLARIRGFTATLGDPGDEAIEMGVPIAGVWGAWNAIQVGMDEEIFVQSGYVNLTGGGTGPGAKSISLRWATSRGTPTSGPLGYDRLTITASATNIYSTAGAVRIGVTDSDVRIYPNGWGQLRIVGGYSSTSGPDIDLVNDAGTYGATLRYQYAGDTYAHRFEHLNGGKNAQINTVSLTHYNVSDMREKTNITVPKKSAREMMKNARGKFYQYKSEIAALENEPEDAAQRFSVMAQDLPRELAQPTADGTLLVSPMAVASMAVDMIHEIEEELTEMRAELDRLRGDKK